MLHIVLLEPEIPQNAGNIARTCAATGVYLHLVEPLGFRLEDRYLKRAGLDYWPLVKMITHKSMKDLYDAYPEGEFYYLTKKADKLYTEASFPEEVFFVFGKESVGLPDALLSANKHKCLRIPMKQGVRSLNLSNSAAVIVYEYIRRCGVFPDSGNSIS